MRNATLVAVIALSGAVASGCAESASGPVFSGEAILQPNATHLYIFRDHVTYLAQAPYISRPPVVIDGRVIGTLPNGGYLAVTLAPGQHQITIGSGRYWTTSYFKASEGDGYIEVADKTRMQGARMVGEAASGAIDAELNAVQMARPATHYELVTGAISNIAENEPALNDHERAWAVTYPPRPDALPRLSVLKAAKQP
jgi:hypothetical protein